MKTPIRASLVVAAVALGLTSCSSGSETLRLVPSGAARNEAAMDSSMKMGQVVYEVQGELPEMPSEFAAYRYTPQGAPVDEAERIAKVFGLEGEMVVDTNAGDTYEEISSYRIGSSDYSGPGMWMYGNGAEWWWNYFPGATEIGRDTAVSSEPCPPDDPSCEVVTPEPPQNLPTENETETLTVDLLTQIGVDIDVVDTQVYVDEWSAWSYSTQRINDVASPISWSFTFGENSELTSASGVIAKVTKDGTFSLADPVAAVERLNDYRYSGWGAPISDAARSSSSYMAAEDLALEDSDVAVDDSDVTVDEPIVTEELETIVIAITSVRMSYISSRTADGKDMLLPAFTYSNADGDMGTVIALSDDVFSFDEETTPGTGEPEPAPEPGVDPGIEPGASEPIPVEKANTLVGLTEDEAMQVAADSGWEYRVASRDGESFMLTTDYVTNRVNVSITNGLITEVTVG